MLTIPESHMPQPINCDQCGTTSVIHSVQYTYQRRTTSDGRTEHNLTGAAALIECRKCGVRTQMMDTGDGDSSRT